MDPLVTTPTQRTQRRRLKRARGGGVDTRRGRGGLPPDRRTVAERYDQADAEHDTVNTDGLMRVDISDWAMVMEALENIQYQETRYYSLSSIQTSMDTPIC